MKMENELSSLFILLDCEAWNHRQIVDWADQQIERQDDPGIWLFELSTSETDEIALEVIRAEMRAQSVSLPQNAGEIMAGAILRRFDDREISREEARSQLIDVIDSYGANTVDPEAVNTMSFSDSRFLQFREIAASTVKSLYPD